MERMGEILARTALRRASQSRPTASGEPATTSGRAAPSTLPPRASRPARVARPGVGNPGDRDVSAPPPAAATEPQRRAPVRPGEMSVRRASGSTPAPVARPDLVEAPPGTPGASRAGAASRPLPADVRPDAVLHDRILEIPARAVPAIERRASAAGASQSPRSSQSEASGTQSPARRTFIAHTPEPHSTTGGNQPVGPARARGRDVGGALSSDRRAAGSGMRESGGGYLSGSDASRAGQAARGVGGPPAPCPICGGAGYVRVDVPLGDPAFGKPLPCECKDRQIEERRRSDLRRLSSLDPFLDKTFDTFDQKIQGVGEGFEVARAFAADPDGWLVLSGPHGVGKTHLAAAIANHQLAQGNSVFFSIVPDLLDHLRAAFAPSSEVTYDEMFDKVREAGLLVLDDLGAENSTAWATEKLFQLINYRYNFRMPTVITTNVRLLSQMDERIRSRLSDIGLSRQVIIKAQDFRERHVGRVRRPGDGDGRMYGQSRDRR